MGEFLAIKRPYCGGKMSPIFRLYSSNKWEACICCSTCYMRTPLIKNQDSPAEATEAAWEIAARMTFKEEQP